MPKFSGINRAYATGEIEKTPYEKQRELDEGVVNSSSTFQDVQGLLKDIAKGGDFVERAFGVV